MPKPESELPKFDLERIGEQATAVANEAIDLYQACSNDFIVEDECDDDGRYVVIRQARTGIIQQKYTFKGSQLTYAYADISGLGVHEWVRGEEFVYFGKSVQDMHGNGHKLELSIPGQGAVLVEDSRIAWGIGLRTTSSPENIDGEQVFSIEDIFLPWDTVIEKSDIPKILPSGRNISLADLLNVCIDPYHAQNDGVLERVARLDLTDGFPTFADASSERVDSEKVYGVAYPLELDGNWLAFVRLNLDKPVGRILEISVLSAEAVFDEQDAYFVRYSVDVEGVEVEVQIPATEFAWITTSVDEYPGAKSTIYNRDKDVSYHEVPNDSQVLAMQIQAGEYDELMLKAAIAEYRNSLLKPDAVQD